VRLSSLGSPRRLVVRATGGLRAANAVTGEAMDVGDGPITIAAAGGDLRAGASQAPALRLEAETLTVEIGALKRTYPGALVLSGGAGGIRLSNECSLESYTEGVLASECPALFHPEAIKAMAVAARSYSYRKAFLGKGDLCDGTHCQVYRGIDGVRPSIHEAVQATEGLCALYQGEVIDAVYSSDCGGCTEANEDAWKGSKPLAYLRPVEDAPEPHGEAYCAVNRSHAWKLVLTRARLQALLGKRDAAAGLEILDRSESGRARRLQLSAAPKNAACPEEAESRPSVPSRVFTGEEWRRALGLSAVKSLKFEVRETETGVVLEGAGWGHGVGLCQFGANGMARQGATFREILKHYYTGVEVAPAPALVAARSRLPKKRMAVRASLRRKGGANQLAGNRASGRYSRPE
jgi:stage II sporulation protein D